jgi:hypothetical protein
MYDIDPAVLDQDIACLGATAADPGGVTGVDATTSIAAVVLRRGLLWLSILVAAGTALERALLRHPDNN